MAPALLVYGLQSMATIELIAPPKQDTSIQAFFVQAKDLIEVYSNAIEPGIPI